MILLVNAFVRNPRTKEKLVFMVKRASLMDYFQQHPEGAVLHILIDYQVLVYYTLQFFRTL